MKFARYLLLAAGFAFAGCGTSSTATTTSRPAANSAAQGTLVAAGSGSPVSLSGEAAVSATSSPASDVSTDDSVLGGDAPDPTVEPGRFFNSNSPWNTVVDGLPLQSGGAAMLARANDALPSGLDGVFINTTTWTTPIAVASGTTLTRVWCRQYACGPDANSFSALAIPTGVNPDPRYDGWFTIVDPQTGVAYDLWRARRQADGSISYQTVKIWALNGLGYSAPSTAATGANTSARGSGLPLFAGLITQPELDAGVIDHALAIGVPAPATRLYVQPASATDGTGASDSLPEGARIVLKSNAAIDVPAGADGGYARTILTALETYGAIVVDRSSVPTLYAQKNATKLMGSELRLLTLSDFEVVQLPTERTYPATVTATG